MDDYKAQLIAVEAGLAKDPDDESLKALRDDLLELIESLESLEGDEEQNDNIYKATNSTTTHGGSSSSSSNKNFSNQRDKKSDDRLSSDDKNLLASGSSDRLSANESTDGQTINSGTKRITSEAELLAKRREKNRKKKAKLREKHKEQLDTAESVKQSWQSFANKPGLKGITKRSIFASPYSLTGKVGVGTNGIADKSASVGGASASSSSSLSSSSSSTSGLGSLSRSRSRR